VPFQNSSGIKFLFPKGYNIKKFCKIRAKPTLFGLNHELYREVV